MEDRKRVKSSGHRLLSEYEDDGTAEEIAKEDEYLDENGIGVEDYDDLREIQKELGEPMFLSAANQNNFGNF